MTFKKPIRPNKKAIVWDKNKNCWLDVEEEKELERLQKIKQDLASKKLLEDGDDEPTLDQEDGSES